MKKLTKDISQKYLTYMMTTLTKNWKRQFIEKLSLFAVGRSRFHHFLVYDTQLLGLHFDKTWWSKAEIRIYNLRFLKGGGKSKDFYHPGTKRNYLESSWYMKTADWIRILKM
jgi:hypothetical protein